MQQDNNPSTSTDKIKISFLYSIQGKMHRRQYMSPPSLKRTMYSNYDSKTEDNNAFSENTRQEDTKQGCA